MRGQETDFRYRCNGALGIGVEGFDAVDFIAKQINAVWPFRTHGKHIQQAAAHGEFACLHHVRNMVIACIDQLRFELLIVERFAHFEPKGAPLYESQRRQFLHGGGHRQQHHVDLLVFQLPQHRQTLRHQILVRGKTLIRQGFPIGEKGGFQLRLVKRQGFLYAQCLVYIFG